MKTERDAVREDQLREHLRHLDGTHLNERLFVVTPDRAKPPVFELIYDVRLSWFSFTSLDQTIAELIVDASVGDANLIIPEQTRFLLQELRALFAIDGLLDHNDVLVVAARVAYDHYLLYGDYLCQPDRKFRAVKRIGARDKHGGSHGATSWNEA